MPGPRFCHKSHAGAGKPINFTFHDEPLKNNIYI
jgi:hypothetical protein